jgi:hypothetical protein
MEERKTAAWVLGTLGFAVVFFAFILPEVIHRSTHTLKFKNCTIRFKYDGIGTDVDIYRANQSRLALCLCNSYKQNPNAAVKHKIINIYRQYNRYSDYDTLIVQKHHIKFDSILKYKNGAFDTLVLVD